MKSHPLLVPSSIVIAGALVGAGVFFGLRDRPAPAPAQEPTTLSAAGITVAPLATGGATAGATAGAAAGAAPTEPVRTPPPGVTPELQARVDRQTAEAFAREKARLVRECWEPSVKANPQPASLTLRVRVLFEGGGTATDVAVAPPDAESRRDVAECIRKAPPAIRVEPGGTMMGTQLSIAFP